MLTDRSGRRRVSAHIFGAQISIGAMADPPPLLDLVSSFLGPPPEAPPRVESAEEAVDNDGSGNFYAAASTVPSHAKVIVFSKDRPWQLQQLLRSMDLSHSSLPSSAKAPPPVASIDVHIIARVVEPFVDGYRMVQDEFEGFHVSNRNDTTSTDSAKVSLSFLREDDGVCSFECLLERVINEEKFQEVADNFVMFLTDDCVLLEPIRTILLCASSVLMSSNRQVLGFLSRLHPGISFCQTRNVPCPPPREEMHFVAHLHQTDVGLGASFIFDRKIGIADWSYPFDLSGGVYRLDDVRALLKWIDQKGREETKTSLSYSHPNRLEISGNAALAEAEKEALYNSELGSLAKRCNLNAAPTRPFLLILAINRVQDVCKAPIAKASRSNENTSNDDVEDLLNYLHQGKRLDIDAYRALHFNSSHVGDLVLSDDEDVATPSGVSVLIPIHKGPKECAAHAINSILMQSIDEYEGHTCGAEKENVRLFLSPMQVVIVDDRCTDGSIDAMTGIATAMTKSSTAISLTVRDMRSRPEPVTIELLSQKSVVDISIDIVPSERSGVASALNTGLQFCSHDVVARMDADDVSCPGRLLSQVHALGKRPELSVIGTSSLLFRGISGNETKAVLKLPYSTGETDTTAELLRSSLPSADPGFVAWAMLFTCCISHPSCAFRKSVIDDIGGYDESISRAEDYDLWNRLLLMHPRSTSSLPNIGLFHRKHKGSSTSGVNSTKQDLEATKISFRAMKAFVDDDEPELLRVATVATLKKPDSASSQAELDNAARLLVRIERRFIDRHSDALSERETALIRLDCDARTSELATLCIQKFRRRGAAWKIWSDRCPDQNLERLALVCHLTM